MPLQSVATLVTKFKMISAQLEANTEESFELLSLLSDSVELFITKLKYYKPMINVHGDKVELLSYPVALKKVLSHLMQNSIDHAFIETKKQVIDISIKKKTDCVEIIFQDNGKGLDTESIRKIFDPFYTTNMGNKNIGIGLSVVYNIIVQLMRGTIICEPSNNCGTSFRITLPLTND